MQAHIKTNKGTIKLRIYFMIKHQLQYQILLI